MPTILIVDDEADARRSLLKLLRRDFTCEFMEAKDGKEAVEFVNHNPCDIMILDIKLPGKGGIAVIKEAKAANPAIDILVLSGWVSDDVADEALMAGAADYAVKPVDFKVIKLKLSAILDKRGQKVSKT